MGISALRVLCLYDIVYVGILGTFSFWYLLDNALHPRRASRILRTRVDDLLLFLSRPVVSRSFVQVHTGVGERAVDFVCPLTLRAPDLSVGRHENVGKIAKKKGRDGLVLSERVGCWIRSRLLTILIGWSFSNSSFDQFYRCRYVLCTQSMTAHQ